MPACLALTREHEPWRAANRASAISCGASHLRLKSATGIHTLHHTDCSQDCGLRGMCRAAVSTTCFHRPPRHECGPRPHTNTPASQAARIWGSVISFAAIAKFLLDRIYRIIRIMKSPKTLAHCKNLVNPVNPV